MRHLPTGKGPLEQISICPRPQRLQRSRAAQCRRACHSYGGATPSSSVQQGLAGQDLQPPTVQDTAEQYLEVNGHTRLSGHVDISGSKNSTLALLAATLLTRHEVVLKNVPNLVDVHNKIALLQSLGMSIAYQADSDMGGHVVARADALTSGPLLARLGHVAMPLPGGCDIGSRPVDLHIRGLAAMGAQVDMRDGRYHLSLRAPLQGTAIFLDYPSVGATETLLMAGTVASGTTTISNAAMEPEVVELAQMLTSMGATIHGAGTSCIEIRSPRSVSGTEWTVMPDRIEVGTYLAAAAITGSCITVGPAVPAHIRPVISKLQAMGCLASWEERRGEQPTTMRISTPEWPLKATNVRALPFGGFPTDMQPQFTALLATCAGRSTITDTVFESRMGHVPDLVRMGGDIELLSSNSALVNGKGVHQGRGLLLGARVQARDLRGGAALMLAALAAEGQTELHGLQLIDRGYATVQQKLAALGADVHRRPVSPVQQQNTI